MVAKMGMIHRSLLMRTLRGFSQSLIQINAYIGMAFANFPALSELGYSSPRVLIG